MRLLELVARVAAQLALVHVHQQHDVVGVDDLAVAQGQLADERLGLLELLGRVKQVLLLLDAHGVVGRNGHRSTVRGPFCFSPPSIFFFL